MWAAKALMPIETTAPTLICRKPIMAAALPAFLVKGERASAAALG